MNRDPALRERLILHYAPIVKFVASRLAAQLPNHIEENDLVSDGLFGLIGAIDRFEPAREIKFETFAATRIRGAILDALRALDTIPRSVRQRQKAIETAMVELEAKNRRPPTDREIAAHANLTIEEYREALAVLARSAVVALDELWSPSLNGDPVSLMDTIVDPTLPDVDARLLSAELSAALKGAIARLPERERTVITLYYDEGLTLREIGELLGVTESRVSQLHTKATLRLHASLAAHRDGRYAASATRSGHCSAPTGNGRPATDAASAADSRTSSRQATAAARVWTPSLRRIDLMCDRTVSTEIARPAATSWVLRPSARSSRISHSRAVSFVRTDSARRRRVACSRWYSRTRCDAIARESGASPRAAAWSVSASRAVAMSFVRYPQAPARSERRRSFERFDAVSMTTLESGWSRISSVASVAPSPSRR